MRKIDKTHIISTKYKEWEESLGQIHPKYNSSDNKYYYDVVMNLFYCQRGVCAYTEELLCHDDLYDKPQWKNGKYPKEKPEFHGALDHFDPELKQTSAWAWDNFFMVQKDINDKHKRDKEVDDILRPDRDGYNPFELLEYDEFSHVFIANTSLEVSIQQRINKMIETLGINHSTSKTKRKKHCNALVEKINDFGISSWNEEETNNYQFFTAFEFLKQIYNK